MKIHNALLALTTMSLFTCGSAIATEQATFSQPKNESNKEILIVEINNQKPLSICVGWPLCEPDSPEKQPEEPPVKYATSFKVAVKLTISSLFKLINFLEI